jgi:AcrR family transcriptional regulator/DNA-binding PadR family transcriptional regulator
MGMPPGRDGRVAMRRGVAGPRGGGVFLSRVQQARLLDAAAEVVVGEGVKRLSATRVAARAGMSTRTFYDLFADGEDCFLGVFDRAVGELATVLAPVWAAEDEWVERVRGALIVLLASLERNPALARVVFVEALGAGPRVLGRRAEILERLARFIDEGREGSPLAGVLPLLVAEGVVGAAFSIVHARLAEQRSESLMELVNPVMATVVLPYRGQDASARELARAVPELPERPEPVVSAEPVVRPEGSGATVDLPPVKLTERTCSVLAAVGERPGANNREVAAGSGASEPQISRLIARLQQHGLVENRGSGRGRLAKAWWLTAAGAEFLRTGRPLTDTGPAAGHARADRRGKGKAGRYSARAGRPGDRGASRSKIKGPAHPAWRAKHASDRGRRPIGDRPAPSIGILDRRVLLLRAAAAAVDEHGCGAVTVAHITARAKISRRTFYELFVDREQCLLAVMEDIEQQLTSELQAADLGGLAWRERVRLGLWTVLRFFDREPGLARFCVVESARGDDRMFSYRAQLLARITSVIAEGGEQSLLGEFSPLTAEGVTGAVVWILGMRLAATGRRVAGGPRKDISPAGSLSDLLGELMALIVLPYFGPEIAREERTRPAPAEPALALPVPEPGSKQGGRYLALDAVPSLGRQLRMTYRTALVLEAIAQAPGISNLGVAGRAQINDQGQISKLLSRLERNGLVQNTGRGHAQGAPNEWRLTPAGEKVERGIREHQKQAA